MDLTQPRISLCSSFLLNAPKVFNQMGELLWVVSSFIGIVREKTDGRRVASQGERRVIALLPQNLTGL